MEMELVPGKVLVTCSAKLLCVTRSDRRYDSLLIRGQVTSPGNVPSFSASPAPHVVANIRIEWSNVTHFVSASHDDPDPIFTRGMTINAAAHTSEPSCAHELNARQITSSTRVVVFGSRNQVATSLRRGRRSSGAYDAHEWCWSGANLQRKLVRFVRCLEGVVWGRDERPFFF